MGIVSMGKSASHNEIVAWDFEIEFGLYNGRIHKFDSRAPVRKINDRACQSLSVVQDDYGRFKDRSSSELAPFRLFFYRQGILVRSV